MFAWIGSLAAWVGGAFGLLKGAMGSGVSLGTLASWAFKYGPLIAAVIEFIETQKGDREKREAATEVERGFRVLTETKNPKPLEDAIRARCRTDGCMLP